MIGFVVFKNCQFLSYRGLPHQNMCDARCTMSIGVIRCSLATLCNVTRRAAVIMSRSLSFWVCVLSLQSLSKRPSPICLIHFYHRGPITSHGSCMIHLAKFYPMHDVLRLHEAFLRWHHRYMWLRLFVCLFIFENFRQRQRS